MPMVSYSLILLLLSAPAWSQASIRIRPSRAAKAEDMVRKWLDKEPQVRLKIARVQDKQSTLVAASDFDLGREELKDSVADDSAAKTAVPAEPPQNPWPTASTPLSPESRREFLATLPGMRAPVELGCLDMAQCATPPLATDIAQTAPIQPAIRAMLRPWLWLQKTQRLNITLSQAKEADDERLLEMSIPELFQGKIGLNISPKIDGGFHLWFDRGLELAVAYSQAKKIP